MIRRTIIFVLVAVTLCVLHSESTAQWVQTGGPPGGCATCLTTGPGGLDLFAGTSGGVFRSSDGGLSWRAANKGLPGVYVDALLVVGQDLFAGTFDGLFRSTNNGTSWIESNNGLGAHTSVMGLVGFGTDVLLGTDGQGVYASSDGGEDWQPVNIGLTEKIVYKLAVCGPSLIAGTANGIFVSRDRGTNWVESDSGLPKNSSVISLIVEGTELFTSVWSDVGTHHGEIFRSIDSGKSWTSANIGLTGRIVSAIFTDSGMMFAGTDSGVYLSNNRATSWAPARTNLGNSSVRSFARIGEDVVAGTTRGIIISKDNGVTWIPGGPGIVATDVLTLAQGDGEILAGTNDAIAKTTDLGASWSVLDTSLAQFEIHSLAVHGTTLLAGTRYGGGFRSTDEGKNWTVVIPTSGESWGWVHAISVFGSRILAGTGSGLQRSTDDGISWNIVSGVPLVGYCFAAMGENLFVGGSVGVARSLDDGMTWTRADTGLHSSSVNALAVVGTRIFAGTNSGVFVSTNNGSRWIGVDSGLTVLLVACLAANGNNLFAGTWNEGIFLLTIPDTIWTCVNSDSEGRWFRSAGSMNIWINSMLISNGFLLAGTELTGAWRRPLSEMVTGLVRSGAEVPITFCLCQNYPNPFNPTTTIRYSLPHGSQVLLTVYNTLGQRVATLVQGQQEAGSYGVKFDGTGLATGVYFYRLQAGSNVDTKKLVFLR